MTAAHAVSAADVALDLRHITKRFGNTLALHDVSFQLRQGTVHALLGENGAGKTTLMRIAFGVDSADDGIVMVRGAAGPIRRAVDSIRAGVGMVHQHFTNVGRNSGETGTPPARIRCSHALVRLAISRKAAIALET